MILLASAALLAVAALGAATLVSRARWSQNAWVVVACVVLCIAAIVFVLLAPPPTVLDRVILAISTLGAATTAGWPVTGKVLERALRIPSEPSDELPATGWVGLVERFGFTLALILGLPEVAALLLGVKALGSYAVPAERGNTTPAARVLGTLTSVGWALLASAGYLIAAQD